MNARRAGSHPCDVVIIGSGIGGLTAGAYLAKHGARVLICEQGRNPGGYFASFKQKGYTFDGGIQGCENTGILLPMLRELDLLDRIELRYSKLAYGFPETLCPLERIGDLARFYGHLQKVFPHESSEIHSNPDFYGRALMMVMVPTLHDPALAPKGKSVVILQCAASMRSMDRWGTQNGKPTRKYRAYKKAIAHQLIRNAEQVIPGLSSRIEVQIESTPFTLRRYTLNSAGASVGWTAHPRETFRGGLKGLLGSGNTPIRNLYQVGHWTMSPGGAPAALMTGKIVSSVLRQRLRWGI